MRCTLGNNTANYSYNKWLHHRRHVDGSVVFDRWCQCVPHLIHRPWAYPTQHQKRHLDQFSRFRIAHIRQSLYFTMGHPFALKIAHSHERDLDPI